jgi:hypothetical protein
MPGTIFFYESISLCSSSQPGTCNPPASASQMLGLQDYARMSGTILKTRNTKIQSLPLKDLPSTFCTTYLCHDPFKLDSYYFLQIISPWLLHFLPIYSFLGHLLISKIQILHFSFHTLLGSRTYQIPCII